MKFLIDTNILIAAEPTSVSDVETGTDIAVLLIKYIQMNQHEIYIHPASLQDLDRDSDVLRKKIRLVLLKKYLTLEQPPDITEKIVEKLGNVSKNTRDYVDHLLLTAVYRDAVDCLVTEDQGMLNKGIVLGLADRVVNIDSAVRTLRGLYPQDIEPPPAVEHLKAYELDENDAIFNSFRMDYPEFPDWLSKCKRGHRNTWLIRDSDEKYVGVSIVKSENEREYGLSGKILKICSFKIAEKAIGKGYSELLLKAVLDYAFSQNVRNTYVEVLPKYGALINFLHMFGFSDSGQRTSREEYVFIKPLVFTDEDYHRLSAMDFHIRFGPKYFKFDDVRAYIVPIQPQYHALLFPDIQTQLPLLPGLHAYGNAIRKAYLCNSPIKAIPMGSILLFYRTHDVKTVQCIGIVEKTIRSNDPIVIERFVGPRTVYSSEDINLLCTSEVLAINFRCAHPLKTAGTLDQLKKACIIKGPPQSICVLSEGGLNWLRNEIRK